MGQLDPHRVTCGFQLLADAVHILPGVRGVFAHLGQQIGADLVLATDPESTYRGTLKSVETRAQTNAELGNIVRVKVALADQSALPSRRIGAEVRAKIDTGPRALGYVLFGDVIDCVRKHLWL